MRHHLEVPPLPADAGIPGRVERAATLLLAASALAALALVGWGGLVFDPQPSGQLVADVVAAFGRTEPVWPGVARTLGGVRWDALWPVVGTLVSLLFVWHVLSLGAEVLLLVGDGLGWLRVVALRPLWRVLDLLDSAPLAAPKRIAVATVLAAQVAVRQPIPVHAAPVSTEIARVVNDCSMPRSQPIPRRAREEAGRPWLVHRVRPGDTAWGMSKLYYGHGGYWRVVFSANQGATMAIPGFGTGAPIRFTNPDFLLPDWDARIPFVPGHLEQGPNGEIIYVVQPGDTMSGIADRFDVSLADLWAANVGTQTPDGRVLENPNVVWSGTQVRVGPLPLAPVTAEPEPEVAPAAPAEPAPVPPTPAPTPLPVMAEPSPQPAPFSAPPGPPVVRTEPPAATPAPLEPGSARQEPGDGRPLWPIAPVLVGGAVVVAAGAALARRRRRRLFETDPQRLRFNRGRVAVSPAHAFESHVAGDPAELAAAVVLRLVAGHGVADVRPLAVYRDPREITVVLAAPADQRDRLRLLLPAAAGHLAYRVTVWATAGRDLAVRLEDPRPDALAAPDEAIPLLVSIGGLGDGRELLAGWDTLGHLLVVSQPETDDASVQLTASVAMLSASAPADRVHLYTCAGADSPLEPLSSLPHQRVVARTPAAAREVLAALEHLLDVPRADNDPERVLVLGELGALGQEELATLDRLLALGPAHGLRVLAACTDLARAGEAAAYPSRVVFALGDEETSVRVLGSPEAAALPADGSMLLRLAGRAEAIEAYQLRVPEDELAALVARMGASTTPSATAAETTAAAAASGEGEGVRSAPPAPSDVAPATDAAETRAPAGADDRTSPANGTAAHGDAATTDDTRVAVDGNAADLVGDGAAVAAEDEAPPPHVAALLGRAEAGQLVLQCLGGLGVWCRDAGGRAHLIGPGTGPGQLGLTRQLDLLVYLAVRTAAGERTDEHPAASVAELEARTDLWGEAASKYLVGLTAARLLDDLKKVGVQPPARPVRVKAGQVSLDEAACLVDIRAFQRAVADARKAGGPDGLAAAEAAVAAYGGPLLDGLAPAIEEDDRATDDETTAPVGDSRSAGSTARGGRPAREPLLGWAQELPALRVADKLEALHRQALRLLADRLRDAGRGEEALERAWDALRAGKSVLSEDAEHLGALVLEAAALHNRARLDAEYHALERHLDRSGLEMPEHVQKWYAQLRRVLETHQEGRWASGNGSPPRPVVRAGVQGK